jgi:molybdopterin molybdotransferase
VAADLITIAEARRRVLGAVRPLSTQTVPVQSALDRVLAQDVVAAGDLPPFASSAMDGYALEPGPEGRTLAIVGESRAGAPAARRLDPGGAIRISTGAAVPAGAGAVIRQEDTEVQGDRVLTRIDVGPGENIRQAGEDQRAGITVLSARTRLGPAELGAAVGAGAGDLIVGGRPRLAVLCTGDELRAPGEPLGPGQIHNSNAPMLAALATRSHGALSGPERVRDDRGATGQALAAALRSNDVVVISGGVSVGPHDHVKPALEALGVTELFWGVSLQPGKPTWFGATGDKLVFGLPGNPVSALVTFVLFVTPALSALAGERVEELTTQTATLSSPVRRNPRREQAVRVRLESDDGRLVASPNGPQGSHLISSLLGAGALALIPPGEGVLDAGSPVDLVPLPR